MPDLKQLAAETAEQLYGVGSWQWDRRANGRKIILAALQKAVEEERTKLNQIKAIAVELAEKCQENRTYRAMDRIKALCESELSRPKREEVSNG